MYSLTADSAHQLNLGQQRGHGYSAGSRENVNVQNTNREDNFVLGKILVQGENLPRTTGQPTALTDFTEQNIASPHFESSAKPNVRFRKADQRPFIGLTLAGFTSHSRTLYSEENRSPMPKVLITIISSDPWCLSSQDGSYGLQMGDQVNALFFYQVEATTGTTEIEINGIILKDIEKILLESMLPIFFSECEGASKSKKADSGVGKYIGMSSKPSDFVLRGFDCTTEANEPCFVVSGSMTIFVSGIDHTIAQTEIRKAINLAMESGVIVDKVSRVLNVSLLDDSLNLATLPLLNSPASESSASETPAQTPKPTTSSAAESPSSMLIADKPSFIPISQPSTMPTTLSQTITPITFQTTEPSVVTEAPSSEPPPLPIFEAVNFTGSSEIEAATALPNRTNNSQPTSDPPTNIGNGTESASFSESSEEAGASSASLRPTKPSSPGLAISDIDNRSAFEKIPVWIWVVAAVSVCICCSYTDPDDEEENGVTQTLREQERHGLATLQEHDRDRDPLQESENFSTGEYHYVRKLYRQ